MFPPWLPNEVVAEGDADTTEGFHVVALSCRVLSEEEPMMGTFKAKLILLAGCCVGSLGVGLLLASGSLWLSSVPRQTAIKLSATTADRNVSRSDPTTTGVPGSTESTLDGPRFATTRDGRFVHPVTGHACPVGTRP